MSGPPTFGRPSPAAALPAALRAEASSADAAFHADGGDGDRWRIRAATVAGVRHRLDGRPGEDAYAWGLWPHGLVAAVADGVSATPEAGLAARVAVRAACGTDFGDVAAQGPSSVCAAAVHAAHGAVAKAVGDAASGATTLVVVALCDDGRWAASRVGDSDVVLLEPHGVWQPVFPMPDEQLRSGATDALPASGFVRDDAAGHLVGTEALALMSDGVAGPLRDGPSTVAIGLAEGLATPPSPLELARLIDFVRLGCHDDRTLLAVWPSALSR